MRIALPLALLIFFPLTLVSATRPKPGDVRRDCVTFTIVSVDSLNNMKWGASNGDVHWITKKLEKKYPNVCYVNGVKGISAILLIRNTPAVYNGSKTVDENSTVSDEDGEQVGTIDTDKQVPYSFRYSIYTLDVMKVGQNKKLIHVHTFQQRGIYHELYGIPLGGRGHHPEHAVIEDAAEWLSAGGLDDPTQGTLQSWEQNGK